MVTMSLAFLLLFKIQFYGITETIQKNKTLPILRYFCYYNRSNYIPSTTSYTRQQARCIQIVGILSEYYEDPT